MVERSPSLALLLHRAERSAAQAGAPELLDVPPDELALEAEGPDLHRADAAPSERSAWDASDAVRPDVTSDAERRGRHPDLADADAGKLADPEPDVREPDASFPQAHPLVLSERTGRGGGALYTGRGPVCGTIIRGAGAAADPQQPEVQPDAARPEVLAAWPKPRVPMVLPRAAEAEQLRPEVQVQLDGGARQPAELVLPRAFQPEAQPLRVALAPQLEQGLWLQPEAQLTEGRALELARAARPQA